MMDVEKRDSFLKFVDEIKERISKAEDGGPSMIGLIVFGEVIKKEGDEDGFKMIVDSRRHAFSHGPDHELCSIEASLAKELAPIVFEIIQTNPVKITNNIYTGEAPPPPIEEIG